MNETGENNKSKKRILGKLICSLMAICVIGLMVSFVVKSVETSTTNDKTGIKKGYIITKITKTPDPSIVEVKIVHELYEYTTFTSSDRTLKEGMQVKFKQSPSNSNQMYLNSYLEAVLIKQTQKKALILGVSYHSTRQTFARIQIDESNESEIKIPNNSSIMQNDVIEVIETVYEGKPGETFTEYTLASI